MNVCIRFLLLAILASSLSGCMDRVDLEDATITLMSGVDVNDKNELLFYLSSPVFSKEAKKKSEEFGVKASSFREAREKMDEMVTALTLTGKIQMFVIGKRLSQQPDWYQILDVIFRDARSSVNARMVVYDGPLHELFHFQSEDKPRLALHLTKLIDTANRRSLTVNTRVQKFHRQLLDKGITPVLTELKKEGKIVKVAGTALLGENGTYSKLIEAPETILLQMLLHEKTGEISLSLPLPDPLEKEKMIKERVSFYVKDISNEVKTSYQDGHFRFDVRQKLSISISERLFPYDMEKNYTKMEQQIEKELSKIYLQFIKKCQKARTDPVGFGVYARAYHYQEWNKVKENWARTFAESSIHIVPEVTIRGNGLIQ